MGKVEHVFTRVNKDECFPAKFSALVRGPGVYDLNQFSIQIVTSDGSCEEVPLKDEICLVAEASPSSEESSAPLLQL